MGSLLNPNSAQSAYSSEQQLNIISDDDDEEYQPESRTTTRGSTRRSQSRQQTRLSSPLRLRVMTEDMVQIFTCPVCDVLPFRYILHYNTHMDKFHWQKVGEKQYQCSVCPVSDTPVLYSSIKEVLLHSKCHDVDLHHCSYCTAVFPVVTYKVLHERNEHFSERCKEQEFGCEKCAAVFRSRMLQAKHAVLEHGQEVVSMIERLPEVYQCNHCDDYIKSHKNLMLHMKKHIRAQKDGPTLGPVLTEDQTFPTPETKLAVQPKPSTPASRGSTLYICPICDVLPFQNEKHYLQHVERLHWQNTSDGMYACSVCTAEPQTFTGLGDAMAHSLAHTDRYHYCRFCDACFPFKKYTSIHERNDHLLVDLPKPVYRCDMCREGFDRRRSLAYHCIKRHEKEVVCLYGNVEEVYKCNHCTEPMKSQHDLILHIPTHNDMFSGQQSSDIVNSSLADDQLNVEEELGDLLYEAVPDTSTAAPDSTCLFFICPVCDVPPFQSQSTYTLHMERFHYIKTDNNTYTCAYCKSSSATFSTLPEMLSHACEEMKGYYKCHHCDAVFTVSRLNTLHERNEHGAPLARVPLAVSVSCSLCGEQFMSRKLLARHCMVVHGMEGFTMEGQLASTYHCNFCQKSFPHTKALLNHITEHSQDTTGKPITNPPPSSSNHTFEGTPEPPPNNREVNRSSNKKGEQATLYVCPICDSLPFRREALYEAHMSKYHWIRTPDSKFACTECQDSSSMFECIKEIAQHSLSHVDKLEKCNFCDACVPTAIYRTLHERNEHVGRAEDLRKTYVCEVCGEEFGQRRKLAFHSLMVHDMGVYSFKDRLASVYGCNHCKQYIKSRVELLGHIKGHKSVCNQHYRRIDAIREGRGDDIKHNTSSKLKILKGRHLNPKRRTKNGPLSSSTLLHKYKLKAKHRVPNNDHRGQHSMQTPSVEGSSSNLAYVCPICDVHPFRYESYFDTHMEQMHWKSLPDNKYMCSQCKKSTQIHQGMGEITEHAQRDMLGGNNVFQCEKCDARFYNKHQVTLHVRNEHAGGVKQREEQFACEECGQEFHRRRLLAHHMLVSHGRSKFTFTYVDAGSLYRCNHCDVRCGSSKQLSSHMATHKLLFLRDLMPAVSSTSQALTPGSRKKRTDKTGPYLCSDCGLVFNSKRRYAYHVPIHWKEYKYECEACHKTFPTRQRLMLHDRFHTRKYMCNDCGERFAQLGHLKSHQKSNHTREPCYFCEICGSGFLWTISLRRHMFNAHQIGEKKRLAYVRKLVECQICNHRLDRSKRTKHFRSRHKDLEYSLNYFVPVDEGSANSQTTTATPQPQQELPVQPPPLQPLSQLQPLQPLETQHHDVSLLKNVTHSIDTDMLPSEQHQVTIAQAQHSGQGGQIYHQIPYLGPGASYMNPAVIQTEHLTVQTHEHQPHGLTMEVQHPNPTTGGQEMCVTLPSQENGQQQTIMLYIPQ